MITQYSKSGRASGLLSYGGRFQAKTFMEFNWKSIICLENVNKYGILLIHKLMKENIFVPQGGRYTVDQYKTDYTYHTINGIRMTRILFK